MGKSIGQLCNSFAIGSEVKKLNVLGADNMIKYEIIWTAIDWCATSTTRQISYTQEVIAVIDPGCDATTNVTVGNVFASEGKVTDQNHRKDFILYQNHPNPFDGYTMIGFELPESTEARLTIYDITGRALKVVEGSYAKGYNEVEIGNVDLPSGLLYYQMDTEEYTATKRMIFVK